MSNWVLDASAVLALLNNEQGAERVSEVLGRSAINTVNLCEVRSKLTSFGADPDEVRMATNGLGIEIVVFDEALVHLAASLVPQTRALGLSLGDRACIALGLVRKQRVVTADRAWLQLDLDIDIECIRADSRESKSAKPRR